MIRSFQSNHKGSDCPHIFEARMQGVDYSRPQALCLSDQSLTAPRSSTHAGIADARVEQVKSTSATAINAE